jgi:nitrite reductase/ring-hydroxylating ferredoxin subunit
MNSVVLLRLDDLAVGSMRKVSVPDLLPLAVYNVKGTIFVTDDTCTHGQASLTEGFLDGEVVECPLHGGAFDVRTGEVVSRPCTVNLKTYPVSIVDGMITVSCPRLDACQVDRALRR